MCQNLIIAPGAVRKTGRFSSRGFPRDLSKTETLLSKILHLDLIKIFRAPTFQVFLSLGRFFPSKGLATQLFIRNKNQIEPRSTLTTSKACQALDHRSA